MYLIVLVAQHTRSYVSAITLAQAKLRSRSIGISAIMVLTNSDRFKLRAKKALETGDASFKPRGEANKAMFEKMKAEFDKKAKEINLHTSSVGDRVVKETTAAVLEVIGQNTQPNPERTRMAAIMAGPSTAVKVLNSILRDEGIECKGTKTDKADILANTIPVHRLVKLLEEHKSCATSKPKAKGKAQAKAKAKGKGDSKPAASSATASTAAPESDRDEGMENQSRDEEDLGIIPPAPLPESRDEGEESSDEEESMPPPKPAPQQSVSSKEAKQDEESSDEDEPMPPMKPTKAKSAPQKSVSSKDANQDEESSDEEEPMPDEESSDEEEPMPVPKRRCINPNANVVLSEPCDDAEKEKLRKPISDVIALLKDCKTSHDVKSTFHDYLPTQLDWPTGYELNWKEGELAVYLRRKSPYPYQLGELLCKVSRKV